MKVTYVQNGKHVSIKYLSYSIIFQQSIYGLKSHIVFGLCS
jgi:hypothetical protein